jgi:hypothetical protein
MSSILQKEIVIGSENTSLVESTLINGLTTPLIRNKTIKTPEYFDNLAKKLNYGSGLVLPRNCRFVMPINSSSAVVVVEDKPKLKSIRLHYDFRREHEFIRIVGQESLNADRFLKGQKSPYSLKLSFPYIIYIMLISEKNNEFSVPYFHVFFRKNSITRFNDYLNIANLLNLSDGNSLCFGRPGGYSKEKNSTLSDLVDNLIRDFWNRPFTDEYQSRHFMYKNHSRLHSFLVWAHYSEIDPLFVYGTDWIIHNRNLIDEINFLKKLQLSSSSTAFKDTFMDSMNTSLPSENSLLKFTYDNIVLTDQILNLGDQIKHNNQDFYLYNLIGNNDGSTHAILIDDNGTLTDPIELTNEIKQNWREQIEHQLNNYVDQVQFGDKIAKVGNIVKILPNSSYEIIQKIRLTRDKKYEFVLGRRFYVATESVFEIIDSIEVNGTKLEPGHSYLMCNNQHQVAFKGLLVRIENNNFGVLFFFFKDEETDQERGISVDSLEDQDTIIWCVDDENIINPPVFRYLDRLYVNENNYIFIKGKGIYSKYSNSPTVSLFPINYTSENIVENIFDGQELKIPSIDIDINFKIGDEVIIGDWSNPDELMFKIRKISGFTYDNREFDFKLTDSDNVETLVNYINLENGYIKAGYIRKVKSEYDGIVAGTRVKSINSNLLNFPKRTNYEIASFIVDSEKPMVLFKNGTTIWFDELRSNFEILSPGSERYKRIRSIKSFDQNKIKWQSGDLCEKDGKLFLVNNENEFMGIIYMGISADFVKTGSLRSRAEVSEEVNPNFKRYGIINPRYRKNNINIIHETIPNFHNGYIEIPFDGYYPSIISKEVA